MGDIINVTYKETPKSPNEVQRDVTYIQAEKLCQTEESNHQLWQFT